MNDRRKTKAQLIEELEELRSRLAEHERARATERSSLEREQLERLAAHGAWVVDTDFIVRVANQAMCRLLDKSPDEVVGSKCYELISGPGCHTESCAMRRAFAEPSSVVLQEKRKPLGHVPLTCRVVAHLVHDRGQEAVGIVEELGEPQAGRRSETEAPRTNGKNAARARDDASLAADNLAAVALDVVAALRGRLSDDVVRDDIARLEEACAPWSPKVVAPIPRETEGKPDLHEVGPHRSVLVFAPPSSHIRGDLAEVVRRAGYSLFTAQDEDAEPAKPIEPIAAILDLALGEPVTDELHARLRAAYPQMPIFVVSSSVSDALEARRWRRAYTWYVPRAVGGDELVRLIEDVTPRPAIRTRG